MKFKKWIKQQGKRNVARMLGTESPTVYAWLIRRAIPKALVMEQLVKLGKGAFNYQDIIDDCRKVVKK